jgi:hypothetical protein
MLLLLLTFIYKVPESILNRFVLNSLTKPDCPVLAVLISL